MLIRHRRRLRNLLIALPALSVATCGESGEPPATAPAVVDARLTRHLLGRYEPAAYHEYRGAVVGDQIVFHRPRRIGAARVLGDFTAYHFDARTRRLLQVRRPERPGLPEHLPEVIARWRAEALAEGEVRFSELVYIQPDSPVFELDPVPVHPCWVVASEVDGFLRLLVVDAVSGIVLGTGVPPPA